MSKQNQVDETNLENIESSLTRAEQFIEKNLKLIVGAIVAVLVIVGGFMSYSELYLKPMESEASDAMFQAQYYFEQDSLALALNGDGQADGFLAVAENFSGTKAANLANYYAGICLLKLGQYAEAIEKLDAFSTDNPMFQSLATGLKADANSEQGSYKEAVSLYKKAAQIGNSFTAPKFLVKAAVLAEKLQDNAGAISLYKELKNKYPKSLEARDADKLIEYLK